jgi:benzoyl-CoA reductase/2-hydroxyglutaryl-CoA dehydratase subunit BcrC/BadD/HgdB
MSVFDDNPNALSTEEQHRLGWHSTPSKFCTECERQEADSATQTELKALRAWKEHASEYLIRLSHLTGYRPPLTTFDIGQPDFGLLERGIEAHIAKVRELAQRVVKLEEAAKAVKLRIIYVGHPKEPWRGERGVHKFLGDDGPDWSRELGLIEEALKPE